MNEFNTPWWGGARQSVKLTVEDRPREETFFFCLFFVILVSTKGEMNWEFSLGHLNLDYVDHLKWNFIPEFLLFSQKKKDH